MGALKEDLNRLIDSTEDENLLEGVKMILSGRKNYKAGELCNSLAEEQKQQVLRSESNLDDNSWVSNEDLKKEQEDG